ncbi:MAG: DNA repair protein RecN [Solobacterium sp.]|nr:DNA repair protein RecN [Solobacterium sp.]
MIRTISIHNIALIEQMHLQLHSGMLVLSGETGAGKSIIIDAVALILGGRADRDLIRSGCEHASVEAEFDLEPESAIFSFLERERIGFEGNSAILYREISLNGRNICRINGVVVTLAILKEAASFLLNLHGQSEYQFLADPERHLSYLDLMGGDSHRLLIEKTQQAYQKFISNHRYYAKLVKLNETKEQRIETVKFSLGELRKADFHPGDEQKLADESKLLMRASRIHSRIQKTVVLLGKGETESDALHNLQEAARELHSLTGDDPEFGALADRCDNLFYSLEDLVYDLDILSGKYEYNPGALESTESKLDSIRKILRKYGPAEDDVLRRQDELEKEFSLLSELDTVLERTGNEHKKLLAFYRAAAKELSLSRRKIAEWFENKMMNELQDLGMQHTIIHVAFQEHPAGKPVMPSPAGDDRVSFMMSPNPGEPMKPMSAIASGGELSRIMLAVKSIESGRSGIPTMIFDEIDTGISGRMAQAVAEKMISISRRQQVICISHLPQIAAAADHHYLVYKNVQNGRTVTETAELTYTQRIDEIARMISGAQGISENAKQYASGLISAAEEKKKEISLDR